MAHLVIAVIGPGDDDVDPAVLEAATRVGRSVAAAGALLVCGGLGGVMQAAAGGAAQAGGTVLGLLPGDDPAAANPFVTIAVPTGLGEGRNLLVVRAADAVIAIGGAYGTLSEIALALKIGRPVIGLGTWELRRDGRVDPGIILAGDPQEAVRLAVQRGAAGDEVST